MPVKDKSCSRIYKRPFNTSDQIVAVDINKKVGPISRGLRIARSCPNDLCLQHELKNNFLTINILI